MPHIQVDVRMILGRRRAHALELLDAGLDPVDAYVIHEVWHERLGHDDLLAVSYGREFPAA